MDGQEPRRRRRGRATARLLGRLGPWLPPLRRREFWAVQALVLGIALGHDLIETVGKTAAPAPLYLLPTSFYFVPVVYAALNFGLRGSLPTAMWSAFLTLPNLLFWHVGLERIGVIWQLAIILAVAVFVGQRVDRETHARQQAEERERDRRASEDRYRGLFEHAGEGVLLLDAGGRIVEANAAASAILGSSVVALCGADVSTLLGEAVARRILAPLPGDIVPLASQGGRTTWVRPIVHSPVRPGSVPQTQLMLQDVTQQYERQRDLEAYARQMLAAREEEQQRIGRELHDGPIQTLVQLGRRLDEIGAIDGPASGQAESVSEARALADSTADELRSISRAMRPSVLDDLGVAAALKSETTALARRAGLRARFVQVGQMPALQEGVELALLRIAQEALHNVERHANATNVLVRLSWEPERATLTVRDDGRGVGPLPSSSALLQLGKLGIVGMQERARLAGGELRLEERLDGGTSVQATIRLSAAAAGT